MTGGAVGVEGFFILSGFLVSQSWLGTVDVRRFAEKRVRRVVSGLLVAMVFGVFGVGPFVSEQSPVAYLTSARTWLHFPGLFAHQWLAIPGLFPHNLFRGHINGSLWSLRYEIGCYVMTVLVGMLGRRAWRPLVIAIACAASVPLQRFGRFGDVSYGLYLYAAPVQQVLLHVFGPKLPVLPFALATFAITLPLALLSWHFVEAPALRPVRSPEARRR